MTTTFFLLRHATYDGIGQRLVGRTAISLNARGRAEAERLAERLAREDIAALNSSPRPRATETAAPVAARLGLPVEVIEDLDEIDVGRWAGRSFDELGDDPIWQHWNDARAVTRAPGGETVLEAQLRIVRHMERVRRTHPGRGVVLVTHGDVIKAAIAYHLGIGLDDFARFEVSPASISVVAVGGWGAKILSLNEVCGETAPKAPGPEGPPS